jgi:hypothetical protein
MFSSGVWLWFSLTSLRLSGVADAAMRNYALILRMWQ